MVKLEEIIKKNIDKIAKEHSVPPPGSPVSSQTLLNKNKAELEAFLLMGEEEKKALTFALGLLAEIGIQLFDEDSIALMDEFKKKVSEKKVSKEDQVSLREIFGIKPEKLDAIYELGTLLYEGKMYEAARNLFLLLINLDPFLTNGWLALALSLEGMERFENAYQIYSYLTLTNKNPEIYINAIRSAINANHMHEAKILLTQLEQQECTPEQLGQIKQLKERIT